MDEGAGEKEFFLIGSFIQPQAVIFVDLFAGPRHSFFGVGVESGFGDIAPDGVVIMVAPHPGNDIELPDKGDALNGIGIVAYHVTEGNILCDTQLAALVKHHIQRLQIGVNIT
jgi:hypothetical protein